MFKRKKRAMSPEIKEAIGERDELLSELKTAVGKVDRLKDELLDEYAQANGVSTEGQ